MDTSRCSSTATAEASRFRRPHLVSLSHVLVTGNEAGHGGGISVRQRHFRRSEPGSTPTRRRYGHFLQHRAVPPVAGSQIQGGGIYCIESTILMNGGGARRLSATHASQDGGGIGAVDCDMTIAPHGTFGSFNGLVLNEAGRDGGGLARRRTQRRRYEILCDRIGQTGVCVRQQRRSRRRRHEDQHIGGRHCLGSHPRWQPFLRRRRRRVRVFRGRRRRRSIDDVRHGHRGAGWCGQLRCRQTLQQHQ